MAKSRPIYSGKTLVWRQFLIGQTFGVAFAVVLFVVEPAWLMRASHGQFGASLTTILAAYTAFGWGFGAVLGVLSGLAAALVPRIRRADGTVPGLGPVLGFLMMALFIARMETTQTLQTLPTTVLVSLVAAVLVWIGLGYLGRRFLSRYVPAANRSLALKVSALAALVAFVVPAGLSALDSPNPVVRATASPDVPNVVLVVVNGLRPDHLSLYGYDRVTSPNLDRFSVAATAFENAYSHGNRVDIAMPSLLTSQYPSYTGRGAGSSATIADLCRSAGYTTACVAGEEILGAVPAMSRGFDFVDEFETTRFGLSVYRAFAFFGLIDLPTHPPRAPNAGAIADRGIAWLHRGEDRPLFLALNFEDLCPPYSPPRRHETAFSPGENDIDDRMLFTKTAAMATGAAKVRLEDGELDRLVDLYDSCIRYVDEEIGRFLSELELAGLERKTVVIVTADRGTEFMEHGSLYNSELATEVAIRVPLIIGRFPSGGEGRKVGGIVRHVDLLPTVAGLAGASVPFGIHGRNLAAALSGGRTGASPVTIAEGRRCVSVVKETWKLMYVEDGESFQLFDLAADRFGRRDVSAVYAGRNAEMRALVDEYLDLRAGMPVVDGKLMIGHVFQ